MQRPELESTDPAPADLAALDLVHLAEATFGDAGLTRELLGLFDRQAGLLLARMQERSGADFAAMAHTLKGSARGIGAWGVARAADEAERAATAAPDRRRSALAQLSAEIARTRAAVLATQTG